jgi:hypothetical protein
MWLAAGTGPQGAKTGGALDQKGQRKAAARRSELLKK